MIQGLSNIHTLAAGEEIQSGELVLWPGVDGQMAFGDDHSSTYALAAILPCEMVEAVGDDGGAGDSGRIQHGTFHNRQIRQSGRIAAAEFRQYVSAQ